jgi:hypothetical protein
MPAGHDPTGGGMDDPVARMVKFVREQKLQAAFEHARSQWARRLPLLVPVVQSVVEVFQSGLEEPGDAPVVSVLLDVRHDLCPLVIAFERRGRGPDILSLRSDQPREAGASAVFRCEPDGIVYGIRYPFHAVQRDVRPERFVDLGEPEAVQPRQIGHAAADFLEWAAVGEGCGSRKLRFWSSPQAANTPSVQQPVQLRAVAA